MDALAQLIIGIFLLSGAVLAWMGWKGGRWLRILAGVMACLWVYEAQWYGRAFINVRWIDDERTQYQHDAVIAAIQAGKSSIPLAETTDFAWTAVCRLGGYQTYAVRNGQQETDDSRVLKEVLGTDSIAEIEGTILGYEGYLLVFATPNGPYVMEPTWGRFTKEFQMLRAARYYYNRLRGQGYDVEVKFFEKQDHVWRGLCFKPDEIWLSFRKVSY